MMKVWEEIINTAIIGTDKKSLNKSLIPTDLLSELEKAEQLSTEKEIQFLNSAAIICNYKRAGFVSTSSEMSSIEECADEDKSYCSSHATGALQAVINEDNNALLIYWLNKCIDKNNIVTPEYIPLLFQKAERDITLKELVITCCGVRGKWIVQFNAVWLFQEEKSLQTIFDHGRLEERKVALKEWRTSSPVEAREALEKSWAQEQAATKAELLGVLEVNLAPNDEGFLKECWKEKSQKVKEVALKLLKQLPDSFIIKEIWEFVQPLVSYKKSASMLGLLNKETVTLNLSFEIPEHFKSYGISYIDANKIYSEKEFTLDQLIGIIPLNYWEEHFNMKADDILAIFNKKEETEKFISSLARAANTFKNTEWAKILYKKYNKLCMEAIHSFERELQEEIVLADLQNFKDIYSILSDKKSEWSIQFSTRLIAKTAQEPYTYTKAFYKNIIHHFPVSLIEKLDQVTVTDTQKMNYWENIKEEIKKMLAIKLQINQSF